MVIKNEIKEAFDFITNDYDDYMEKTNHKNAQKKISELLQDEINGEVIDIATGTGIIAINIAKKIPNSRVTATDVSEKMIEKARENARNVGVDVNFLVGDIEKSILPDNKFDIVICCLGMPWFTNREMVLKEIVRICKKSGKIILIEEEGETARSKKPKDKNSLFNERLLQFFSKVEKLETSISPKEIEEEMDKLSYKLIKKVKTRIDENHGFVGMVFNSLKQ